MAGLRAPSVGDTVHYVSHGTPVREDGTQEYESVCRAAIITEVPKYLRAEPLDGCPNGTQGQWIASLAVLNPTGNFFNEGLPQDDEAHQGGTWHRREACHV